MKTFARILALTALSAAALSAAPAWAACGSGSLDGNLNLAEAFKDCAPANSVKSASGDAKLGSGGGANATVMLFVTRLTQLGALLAIAGIVYSGFLMVSSTGDDEKASTGKKGLIWSCAGFAAMVLAGPAINAVVNLAYGTLKE